MVSRIGDSLQFEDGQFRNYEDWEEPSGIKLMPLLWDFLFVDGQRTPETSLPRQNVDLSFLNDPGDNQLNATWIGHSSLMINIDGYKILTDPVFENRVSILGPAKFNGEIPFQIDELPDIDVIMISHDHYDHLNKFSVRFLNNKAGLFIVPLAVGDLLVEWGIPRRKIVELDWWEEYRIGNGLMVAATPAQHFSGRNLFDRNKTLWASYVVKGRHHNFFFSGDSGYFKGFKEIGEKYGPFDMTFIECGAYGERWHFWHMFPEETVQAHLDLKGKVLHPIHWGTFNLALHPWDEPMRRLFKAAKTHRIQTSTPVVGESTVYEKHIATTPWWQIKTTSLREENINPG